MARTPRVAAHAGMAAAAAAFIVHASMPVAAEAFTAHVTPGQVVPNYTQTWSMPASTIMMVCNSTGPVDAVFASRWGIVDLDWNGDKASWSAAKPMDNEEDMARNAAAIKAVNPATRVWVYRNGIKALPWFTSVRQLLEDRSQWGLFMPYAGCKTPDGDYVCGPNATQNLYHDEEQSPQGDCGAGIQCGEYVFDHRNASLRSFLLGEYFFSPTTAANNSNITGFYVDDGWSSSGPSEMDSNATRAMGMNATDIQDMIAAWSANQAAWRAALVAAGSWEWFLFYGGQQTAPGWNQTDPGASCLDYMRTNCGPSTPPQSGALFFGFSRLSHSVPFPLPSPQQDVAAFLLTRGPYAWIGFGWVGCADKSHPFTRPPELDTEYGAPTSVCSETSPGVFARQFEHAAVSLDCNSFTANITMI